MTEKTYSYHWQGTTTQGAQVSGECRERSPALLRAGLRKRGIRPVRVERVRAGLWRRSGTLGTAELCQFSRQLASLMCSGVALLQALEVIAQSSSNAALITLIGALKADIGAGSNLADALRKHPRYFDALYCNLVATGEQSGTLERVLEHVACLQEQRQAMGARLRKAMTYPLIVLLTGLGVSSLLLLEVVPQFQAMFSGFGAELPAFTRGVIALSDWLGRYVGWLLLCAVAGVWGLRLAYRRQPGFRLGCLRLALRLPVLGALLSNAALARFARTLSTSFAAGVPLVEALGPVAGACGNPLYEQAVLRLRKHLAGGQSLSGAMAGSEVFPRLMQQMCAIGETGGTLDDMLARVASHYESAVERSLDYLASLLEPMIVLILGVLVGSLVIAMYLPIFQLGSVI
ncbi:type II secretion system F family protein [Pseudomonas sp. P66]|jgi:type IV pilus assembly protein PilC|uniref:Type II secretion system F family protein n=1 Tax=Pseudomonas arcuscaelestis TaxID=2710591 RepID=A0ABS2C2Y8_9PSED|nr:type II secretion system F family protein [Pseudomonas arcuscaelestis]MBM5460244.1 type II secretion system F family protein [Pseudomonas arcuscaelestis]